MIKKLINNPAVVVAWCTFWMLVIGIMTSNVNAHQPENCPLEHQDTNSGGAVVINDYEVSQYECNSPCVVVFNSKGVEDTRSTENNDFAELRYEWRFGDINIRTFEKGASAKAIERNPQSIPIDFPVGLQTDEVEDGPMASHTYICDSGICDYWTSLSVFNELGDTATSWKKITVTSQSEAFAGSNTVCVSTSSDYAGCPTGAAQSTSLPMYNQWTSNTRYLIEAKDTFDMTFRCTQFDLDNIVVGSYGDGKATLNNLWKIGNLDTTCSNSSPSNAQIDTFDNQYWTSNIILQDLRIHSMKLNVTFRNFTFHNIDMNWQGANELAAYIQTATTDYCNNTSLSDCDRIYLPYGLYFDTVGFYGSGVNDISIGAWRSSGLSFVSIVNSMFHDTNQHHVRLEGGTRLYVGYNNFFGDHTKKTHKFSARSEGRLNEDMLNKTRYPSDKASFPDTRYIYVKNNYFGDPTSTQNAALVQISPTNSTQVEIVRWAVIDAAYYDVAGGTANVPTYDAAMAGIDLVCYSNSIFGPKQKCKDRNSIYNDGGLFNAVQTNMAKPQ